MAKRKVNSSPEADQASRRTSRRIANINEHRKSSKVKESAAQTTGPTKASKPTAVKIEALESDKEGKGIESTHTNRDNNANGVVEDKATKSTPAGRHYWLMKAEPESRLEKGHDIKFSIDDLAAKTAPEPWDGIRAYPARNNLRAMRKGDLAFFYHSSCKIPAIVGIMEIVQEHSPDLSAHDPSAPYHDPSSTPENPKWSVAHVEFRQKLDMPITLKDLKAFQSEKGNPLENMQMLKLSRLSVSKVSQDEWSFLTGIMEKNGDKLSV